MYPCLDLPLEPAGILPLLLPLSPLFPSLLLMVLGKPLDLETAEGSGTKKNAAGSDA